MPRADDVLTELVRTRGPALVAYAHLLSGDHAAAQDLVQDALVKVFRRIRRGFEPDAAEAYVRRAILTVFLDDHRRRARFAALRHAVAVPDEAPAIPSVETRLDLRAALGVLGPQHRAAVVLRYYDDLTVPEVAARMNVSTGTAKRYVHDALRRLEVVLGPLGLPDDDAPEVLVIARTHAAQEDA
ncbi:sigma-70 family RNA polymerase sigma factor [Cellulomonas composti]|uniref:RNA polymerase sigma24 factor n=1 Tax=Cellulomonas composti TaxID=266130 RepID=A0A511JCS7_9CELL|nr:sigma-70 family RNA polymerase sigma factor [Cellulomonas composti]GEL95807.1 RNA polymerase sigma24 factor [Cellulomonas composti]